MLLKTIRLDRQQLSALKAFIRLDFARAVRSRMERIKSKPEDTAETTTKVMGLADMLLDYEQPLAIAIAMLETTGAQATILPLPEERFEFLRRTVAHPITDTDWSNVPAGERDTNLEPLRALQKDLLQIFNQAGVIDPQKLRETAQAEAAPNPALMN